MRLITWQSLFCIELMRKHCEVFLSFGPIDFYNDSGWATLTQILRHMLRTLNLDDHVDNVLGADSSLGLCLFVKRLFVVPSHMIISLLASVQHLSTFLILSLCCHNFTQYFTGSQ